MDALAASYVTTGDTVPTDGTFLRGHGTIVKDEQPVATVSGFVERVNKLISIRPLQARYSGEVGDVVVGRITAVADKKWKVDINSRQNGVLMLSSINLPGGAQRRRTVEDQLQMRTFFQEHDLISAEVQQILSDGALSLHTRTVKYGKLGYGMFLCVPSSLIKRCKLHFHSLSCGVDVILGNNGYIWINATPAAGGGDGDDDDDDDDDDDAMRDDGDKAKAKSDGDVSDSVSVHQRERVARVRNCIQALHLMFIAIHVTTIMDVYHSSVELGLDAAAIIHPDNVQRVTQVALSRRTLGNQ